MALAEDSGWSAQLQLEFGAAAGRTVLAHRKRYGPLAVQRPFYPEGDTCHVYLLHPPGGVVGGDVLDIQARVDGDAHALLTTPGATKFYRSAGQVAQQSQQISVEAGARLEWMPQENIFFPGAAVQMQTRIDLQTDARIAWWEIQCLGRPAIDESFDEGRLDSALAVYRDGRSLLLERLRVDADNRLRSSMLRGLPVTATALFNGADSDLLGQVRERLAGEPAAATLIDDLLVLRYLGSSTEQARNLFIQTWSQLRKPLLGKAPNTPRIWAT